MAFETKKTEHNGAKNSGHDKWKYREDLKKESRSVRRKDDRARSRDGLAEYKAEREMI